MSIIDKVEDKVKAWIFLKGLGKGVASLVKLIVSYCAAKGISVNSVVFGIPINTQDTLIMTAAINSGLKMLFNYLKVKNPKLAWLP